MPGAATEFSLATPLEKVRGIGPTLAQRLAALGPTNVGKLVAYLPMRHERLEAEGTVKQLVPGHIGSARGEITATRVVRRGKPRLEAVLMDDTGRLDLVWFNMAFLGQSIRPGVRLRVQGKVQKHGPGVQMVNPHHWTLREDRPEPASQDARLRPVYPASESIDSRDIERAVAAVLKDALPLIEDHLPEAFRKSKDLPELSAAYRMYHAPTAESEVLTARRRLAYDELLLLQLGVQLKRSQVRTTLKAPALRSTPAVDRHIRERFPFPLTPAQDRVVAEIARDLSHDTPTNRLLQGDVGSGKTVVALYAMLLAVASGHQAALMAPTELLAEQHYASISRMLEGSRVKLRLLTGSTPPAERTRTLDGLADGTTDLVIGTHALLTETVRFKSLAVAVIDEQHRFGVHQRAILRSKGTGGAGTNDRLTPHVLVMTATPIPRTLAITLFGDLDISTIDALPPGRRPVTTRVVGPEQRRVVYDWLRAKIQGGHQAYVVVPTIGDYSEEPEPEKQVASVRSLLKDLEEGPLKGLRLAALHGRLKPATRETVMDRFRNGEIDVLVATTVIEVGVDVPNATVMVVEHADRFGLAQLHQLRGRVGRGTADSVCALIADPQTDDARRRIEVMGTISDGFALAEKDFEIRGFGEVLGTRQSGLPPFKVVELPRDRELLAMARRDATAWVGRSPTLALPEESLLRRRLWKTYGESLGLADVG